MDKKDFLLALNDLRECWPRMNLSDRALDIWYEKLGVQYRAADLKAVISEYIETEEKQPTIAILLSKLHQRYPERTRLHERPFTLPAAFPALEWVMDVLTPQVVTREVQAIVGGKSWAALVSQRNWVPAYREKMDELFVRAKRLAGMSDEAFDQLMHEHRYGQAPPMVWQDRVKKTELYQRWSTMEVIE